MSISPISSLVGERRGGGGGGWLLLLRQYGRQLQGRQMGQLEVPGRVEVALGPESVGHRPQDAAAAAGAGLARRGRRRGRPGGTKPQEGGPTLLEGAGHVEQVGRQEDRVDVVEAHLQAARVHVVEQRRERLAACRIGVGQNCSVYYTKFVV